MSLNQYRNKLPFKSDRPSDDFFQLCNYTPYPHQREIHSSLALVRTVSIARQHGKSTLAMVEAAYELCTKPNTVGYVVAPIYNQAQIIFRQVVRLMSDLVKVLPYIKISQVLRGADMRLVVSHYDPDTGDYIGDAIMEGKSAKDPDSLRGGTTNWIIVDEAAMVSDAALTEGLEPTGTTTKPWMLFISTPKGVNNWFYAKYVQGQDPMYRPTIVDGKLQLNKRVTELHESWKIGGTDAGIFDKAWLEDKERNNSAFVYKQEYEAEFMSDSGRVFIGLDEVPTVDPIATSATTKMYSYRDPTHAYFIGADFAKYNDFSVFTVIDSTTNTMAKTMRLNTMDLTDQLQHLKALSREYGTCLVVADTTGMGVAIEEQMASLEIPTQGIRFTNKTKEELISKLSIGIQHKYITLIKDTVLMNELSLFEYVRTETGNLKMQSTRGHDDCVISLALAYWNCSHYKAIMESNSDPDMDSELSGVDFRGIHDLLSF